MAESGERAGNGLQNAWNGFGNWLQAGNRNARESAQGIRRFLPRWNPSRPQQLVLAGILAIAFLELRVPSKFGDLWSMAFVGGDKEQAKPPPPDSGPPPGGKEPGGHPPEGPQLSVDISSLIPPI